MLNSLLSGGIWQLWSPTKNSRRRFITVWLISLLVTVSLGLPLATVSNAIQQRHNTIIMIGDGMGWEITRAAAIANLIKNGKTGNSLQDFYTQGKGFGLNMQKLKGYALATTYGTTVPGSDGLYTTNLSALDDSQNQTGKSPARPNFRFHPKFNPGNKPSGGANSKTTTGNLVGYDPQRGGINPWTPGSDPNYIKYSYPDSANTATTLYTGTKSYNNAIGVDIYEKPLKTILKTAADQGKSTGLVTSVPIDHATPGAAAANVNRRIKYDLNAPKVSPLDNILQQQLRIYQPTVLLGGGHPLSNNKQPLLSGVEPDFTYISNQTYQILKNKPNNNVYNYTFLERGSQAASRLLATANRINPNRDQRLLGLYGARGQNGNLPVSSASGDYSTTGLDMFKVHSTQGLKPDIDRPLASKQTNRQFIRQERSANPTLTDLTTAALTVLNKDPQGFWLMVEGGDIDWSAHDNNLDNLIGTIQDFDRTVGVVLRWIESHGGWQQNQLIVTADHDHYFTLNADFPARLRRQGVQKLTDIDDSTEAGHYWGSEPVARKNSPGKVIPETGKYGWGNHTNRPVPVYYQGFASGVIDQSIGRGFNNYGFNIPGIPGLIDQVHIYQAQLAAVTADQKSKSRNRIKVNSKIAAEPSSTPSTPDRTTKQRTNNINVNFLSQKTLATGLVLAGAASQIQGIKVPLGGLSGVTYHAAQNSYHAISDDRSQFAPARFYTFTLNPQKLATTDIKFTGVTTLKNSQGNTFPLNSLDPEGIAFSEQGTVLVSSEGEVRPDLGASRVTNPFIKEFDLATGQEVRSITIPTKFLPKIQDQNNNNIIDAGDTQMAGVRNNLAFESLTITPNQRTLYTATENALSQDGAIATPETGSRCRILQYNLVTGQIEKEFMYKTDPITTSDPKGSGNNGLVDLLAVNNQGNLLALERSFSPDTGNTIKIYELSLAKATDIKMIDSLTNLKTDQLEALKPVTKTLLLNLNDLQLPTGLDNLEGLTWGEKLANGQQSIILVSDNNFSKSQFTQVLALSAKL
jgi:alkaline phosphatase